MIVCSQSTKRLALAFGPDGDDIADLDRVTGNDDAVDKQLQQLSLAAEIRLLQPLSHTSAERLGMGGEARCFGLAVSTVREFAFLAIEHGQPTFGVLPAALVFGQRHHAGEIGFCEALDLLVQARPGTAQIGSSCLHLLRQPVSPAGPLHCVRDHCGGGQHLAQVAPNQLLQRPARDAARRAALARRQGRRLRRGPADIVVVAPPHMPACAGAAAVAAADQAAQKVFMNSVVSPCHPLIIGQPFLRALELLAVDNSRNSRNRDLLGRVCHSPALPGAAGRSQGGPPPLDGPRAQTVGEDLAEIHGVGQHPAHG